jgi:hypothetical protein
MSIVTDMAFVNEELNREYNIIFGNVQPPEGTMIT